MTTTILKNITLGFIFLTLFIPLYVSNNLFFPFITGKAFAFRIIVEICFALWLVLILRNKKYAPKFSWLSLTITLFAIVVLVADLMGINPLRSIWSNFERMEGWVVIAHLWAYFVVITSMFGSGEEGKRMWHAFFRVSLFAASIVGLYGLFQLFGGADIHQGSSRIDASLGNAAYMAVYMLIHVFIAIYMSCTEYARRKMAMSWIYAVLAVLFSYLLFETGTRGTILGLIGGIMLILGIYSVFGKNQSKKSRFASAGVIALIILIGVAFYFNRDASFIQNNETLRRMASISIDDTKTQARGYIWPMAVREIFESPKTAIIGIGQENFNYIFNANYDPKMYMHEQWFDRAHSVFLDWLVAGGLVGLLLYISLFILGIVSVWKSNNISFIGKSVFTGLLASYAVHNVFVFDNLISYVMFFTVLGFIHSMSAKNNIKWLEIKDEQTENGLVIRDYVFVPIVVILFLVSFYFINVRNIQANTRLIKALNACSGAGTLSADLYPNALKLDQYMANQEIREQLISCSSAVFHSSLPVSVKEDFYNLTKMEIEKQIQATPDDARAYNLGGTFFNNVSDWESGRPILEKAVELSPSKQTILFELATNYMNSGREKEANDLLRKAYELAPENGNARIAYAVTLVLTGQEEKARSLFADHPEIFTDQRIINVYAKLKQYSKIINAYKILIAKEPDNIQFYGNLASAYLANGQQSLAIAELRGMVVKFPQAKQQIEQAIKDIQEGKSPF